MSYEDEDQIAVVCLDVQGIHKIHSIFHYLQSSVPHCWQHIILTFSGGAVFITPVLCGWYCLKHLLQQSLIDDTETTMKFMMGTGGHIVG